MREEIEQIMLLQSEYSSMNTEAMQRRGRLVRGELPECIAHSMHELSESCGFSDLAVEGSDGMGRKTTVPWVRVFSRKRAPSATQGWYVVFLFGASGQQVYLTLMQGTTSWDGAEFKRRPEDELRSRVTWARRVLGQNQAPLSGWTRELSLGGPRRGLGEGYELGSVVAMEYRRDSLPDDARIVRDLVQALAWLGELYRKEDEGIDVPSDASPELVDMGLLLTQIAHPDAETARRGRMSAAERLAVKQRGLAVVTESLANQGYVVGDPGKRGGYDLRAYKDGADFWVLVKATTATGGDILLNRSEVNAHHNVAPRDALAIVHSIELDKSVNPPTAFGGTLVFDQPWSIDESRLSALAYRYRPGSFSE